MVKAPEYGKLIEPWDIQDGPLRKWFVPDKISDLDFRTAMTEAHWLMSLAVDQETAARMRRQSRVGVAGATSRAEIKARELAVRRRDELLCLLGGLLGLHLPQDNAAALKRARELCKLAKDWPHGEDSDARLEPTRQIR